MHPSCHSFWPEGADVVCIDLISWQQCRLSLAFQSWLCPASGAGHVWQLGVLSCTLKCPALAPFGCFWGHAGSWGMRSRVWKLLCTSVEAIPRVLELSVHLCCSKAAKIGVKTQAFAARSGLTVVITLAGSGRRFPIGLALTTTKKTAFLMDVSVSCTLGVSVLCQLHMHHGSLLICRSLCEFLTDPLPLNAESVPEADPCGPVSTRDLDTVGVEQVCETSLWCRRCPGCRGGCPRTPSHWLNPSLTVWANLECCKHSGDFSILI